ncbi:hypothetical protein GH714_005122 [Hevea brasiliensis]|uniref:anthocyanidin 3-O-glucosyltransferase n=1 Tax=Hevea brasiliensis TaxID=3981 RepID=A0A6A6KMP9_HEVBR|nr:hypothetical protein GH714_005122 [Hevea brasiliensis]
MMEKIAFKQSRVHQVFMQSHLQNFIENINLLNSNEQVTLVIADISVGWALEVAGKMGIQRAAFVPNGVGNLAMIPHNPMLIEAGIIDDYGIPMKDEFICLSNEIPAWNTNELFNNLQQAQFNELALGLETLGQPFLWVVQFLRMECLWNFSDGFLNRVGKYGKIVEWAPQEKVLAHPSTACFFTHCGWNSTMKGLNMGVPFLCWPYCADQFHNRSYICETWKVGLGLIPDDNGIVNRHEIKTKLEKLVYDKDIQANSLKLKEMARKSTSEGGSSFKNFIRFVEQINL